MLYTKKNNFVSPNKRRTNIKVYILCLINKESRGTRFSINKKWFHTTEKSLKQKQLETVFLETVVLKICSKFAGEQPSRSVISIKLLGNSCKFATYLHICCYTYLHITASSVEKHVRKGWIDVISMFLLYITSNTGGPRHFAKFLRNCVFLIYYEQLFNTHKFLTCN